MTLQGEELPVELSAYVPGYEPWRGVDLDGTLAVYDGWHDDGGVGEPVPLMLERVKGWLAKGMKIKIMTARVSSFSEPDGVDHAQEKIIQDWTEEHLGVRLEVTNKKDYAMIDLFDDRAFQVEKNTGRVVGHDILLSLHPQA